MVLRTSRGDSHVLYDLGRIFQGLSGQLSVLYQFTVYSAERYESVNFSQLLLLLFFFFSTVKGSLAWLKHMGALLFL